MATHRKDIYDRLVAETFVDRQNLGNWRQARTRV